MRTLTLVSAAIAQPARSPNDEISPPASTVVDDDPGFLPAIKRGGFTVVRQSAGGALGQAAQTSFVDEDIPGLAIFIQSSAIVVQPYAAGDELSIAAQITDDFAYWQFSVPSDGIAQPARVENELPEGIALEYELSGPMLSIPPVFFRQPLGDDGDWSNGQAVLIVGPFGPTISGWTADSGVVTADSINFTCDGADLINGGGSPVPNPGRLASSVSVPLLPSGLYKGST